MTTHSSVTSNQLASVDARTALTAYQLVFIDALGKYQEGPLYKIGAQDTSSALETVYPMTVGDPVFEKVVGDGPYYKRIGEIFLRFTTDRFGAGVIESASRLRSAEWARRGWGVQPAKHAAALPLTYERVIAGALMAGKTTGSIENPKNSVAIKVFQKAHPCDPLGGTKATYDNLFTGAPTVVGGVTTYAGALPANAASLAIVRTLFATQPGQNGVDYRDGELTHILCGPDLEDTWIALLKQDYIVTVTGAGATQTTTLIPNPAKQRRPVELIVSKYLTEPGVWYACSADILGTLPWISLTKTADPAKIAGMPSPGMIGADGLEWTIDDETSELYKHGNKVGPKGSLAVAAELELGAAITLPWRIFRCEPT